MTRTQATKVAWRGAPLIALLLPVLGSCAVLSDNLPLIPPAAFVNAVFEDLPEGGVSIEVEMAYWKTAAPFFVFGFARTELSNSRASDSDFRNMWDRDWSRLLPLDGGRPRAYREHVVESPRTYLNFYMVAWESTTSNELKEYRFCGSRPVGDNVSRLKLSSCD